jgi:hypothetical protein
LIKEGHFNLSTMLNLKRPMDVPYECIQTRAYDINNNNMKLYEQVTHMEINMSKGVGEHLLPLLT